MALQMYIVSFKNGYSESTSRDVQRQIRAHGGVILMVTRSGVIVGLDDSQTTSIAKLEDVGLVGAVSLNPRGYAAERLQRIFMENMSKQFTVEV
jgi:hypothetical protein